MHEHSLQIPVSNERIVSPSELSLVTIPPSERINPIQHRLAREILIDSLLPHYAQDVIETQAQIHEFHTLSHGDMRYLGLISYPTNDELQWFIGISNFGDGHRVMEVHSGFTIPAARSLLSFHASESVFSRYCFRTQAELFDLVNEKICHFRQHFNLELTRMERWKEVKLTEEEAHHVICLAIREEAIAGRLVFEFLNAWKAPACDYFKPRTLWSLFCLMSSFLNRLTAPAIIERTMKLHDFFDGISGFNLKPTPWVQAKLL